MLSAIIAALFDKLRDAGGLPTIYWPNVHGTPPTGSHLRVDVLPAETATLGLTTGVQGRGVIQIAVYTKAGIGITTAAGIADAVLAAMPRNTSITQSGYKIRIDAVGSVAPPIIQDGWHVLPVSIPYVVTF